MHFSGEIIISPSHAMGCPFHCIILWLNVAVQSAFSYEVVLSVGYAPAAGLRRHLKRLRDKQASGTGGLTCVEQPHRTWIGYQL